LSLLRNVTLLSTNAHNLSHYFLQLVKFHLLLLLLVTCHSPW